MRMDSLTEVDQEQLSDIRRITRGGYDEYDDDEFDDDYFDEKPRRFGHETWE